MADDIRVAVIGTGIGAEHIRAMQQVPGATVSTVCSARAERAEAMAAQYGVSRATADYRDCLGPDTDALVITAPQVWHLPMVRDAFAAGKHVLCEKPLAVTMDDAREMVRLAEASGRVAMVNHHQRFSPAFAAMRAQVAAGYLGTPTIADARITHNPADYLRANVWSDSKAGWFTDAAQGGGVLAGSAGPHLMDMLCWMLGDIEAVSARTAVIVPEIAFANGETVRGITAPDAFLAVVRFVGGAMGTIRGVPVAYSGNIGFSIELNGTAGSLMSGGSFSANGALRGGVAGEQGLHDLPVPEVPWDRLGIATAFIEAIRTGDPSPAPNFRDGLRVQAIIAALEEAAASERWVEVESNR